MELLGRDDDLQRLLDRLRSRRLVTVTGPGGIGKSALARRAAERIAAEFPLGAIHVDLTRIDYDGAVDGALAAQLGYPDFESLLQTPVDQAAIVVVDNCEHVLDKAAAAIDSLLSNCEAPTVLATSRSPLDLAQESIISLGPLATPGPGAIDLDAPALALFVERAADHGVELDLGIEGQAAASIVERLDGVPLAIELAAARLRSMGIHEISADLETRTHALARPRFRGRPQHRSVVDLIKWSYDLLDDPLPDFLDNLSVFAGPFTGSMAASVAAPDADDHQVRDRLDELLNASLVSREPGGETSWYRLLHPVRAVARRRLLDRGQAAEVESRHVDHIVTMALAIITRSTAGWDANIVTDLLALYDNMSAALRWSLDNDESPDRAQLLLAVLWGVVHQAHNPEVAELGEAVLQRWPDRRGPTWADAMATLATSRNLLGDHDGAIELARSTLAGIGDAVYAPATLRRVMAQASRACFDTVGASELFREAAEAADAASMNGLAMELWADHGVLVAELGDCESGLDAVDIALDKARRLEAKINEAWCLASRGNVLIHCHRQTADTAALNGAREALSEAVSLSRAISYPAGIACGLRGLAAVRLELGDRTGAAEALLDLLQELQRQGNLTEMRMVLDATALTLEHTPGSSWADLAVTAGSLPVTNVATPVETEVLQRAEPIGRVLAIRDAFLIARHELQMLVASSDEEHGAAPHPADPSDPRSTPADEHQGSAATTAVSVFVNEGDVWRIDYEGRTIRLRRSKGLGDLVTMLQRPGRELTALELMGSSGPTQAALPVLDERSRRDYERRVRELQSDIDEAEADNDLARAETSRIELDALVDQLTEGLGLGGRGRSTGGDAERARSAVTRRIRDAIGRIAAEHPSLGTHLRNSVHTGRYCSYRPDHDPGWVVRES